MRYLFGTSLMFTFVMGLALLVGAPSTAAASEEGVRFEEARLYVTYGTPHYRPYYGHRYYRAPYQHRVYRHYGYPRYYQYNRPYYYNQPYGGFGVQFRIR